MEQESFVINIGLYEELHKYKEFFADALNIYRNRAVNRLSCDYQSDSNRKTANLKIDIDPLYWEMIYKEIEEITKKQCEIENKRFMKTVLVNNIMSCLLGLESYN